ncbi:MAG: hypothetical protein CSA35_05695 [Dethiosulfovibrio peptidovorans]|nr:MAG: hypothetical protein CSA35_05695 [Dethiosulfovibrio peptidovorans]
MRVLYVLLGVVAVVILWAISTYNKLVKMDNLRQEGWSGIDVQLKRRFDLIPNLVSTVQGYASHEKETFQQITQARAAIGQAQTVAQRAQSENMLSGALKSLFAVAENYPELKANTNFLQLQETLSTIEDEIQMARRYYNGTARNFNIAIASFPALLIAKPAGYTKAEYFEAEESETALPHVNF